MQSSGRLSVRLSVYSARRKNVCVLLNFLYFQAMAAILLIHRNIVCGVGPIDLVTMLRGMISAHLRVEYVCFSMKHDVVAISNVWGLGNVLFTVGGSLTVCI